MAQPKDYPLFEHWYKTMDWILDRCERMPKHVRFTVSGRIVNLSIGVAEKIVEAIYAQDRAPQLHSVNLHLEKLRLYFRLCKDRDYISTSQYAHISGQINTAGKMVGGWLKK